MQTDELTPHTQTRARAHFCASFDSFARVCSSFVSSCFLNVIDCDTTKPKPKATSNKHTYRRTENWYSKQENRREQQKWALFAKINVATVLAEANAKQNKTNNTHSLIHSCNDNGNGNNNTPTDKKPVRWCDCVRSGIFLRQPNTILTQIHSYAKLYIYVHVSSISARHRITVCVSV